MNFIYFVSLTGTGSHTVLDVGPLKHVQTVAQLMFHSPSKKELGALFVSSMQTLSTVVMIHRTQKRRE